jgi:hypothetical protein
MNIIFVIDAMHIIGERIARTKTSKDREQRGKRKRRRKRQERDWDWRRENGVVIRTEGWGGVVKEWEITNDSSVDYDDEFVCVRGVCLGWKMKGRRSSEQDDGSRRKKGRREGDCAIVQEQKSRRLSLPRNTERTAVANDRP